MAFLLSIRVVEASSGRQCHHRSTPNDWSRSVEREELRTRSCPADRRRSPRVSRTDWPCQPESYTASVAVGYTAPYVTCTSRDSVADAAGGIHSTSYFILNISALQGENNLDNQKSNSFVVLPDAGNADYILTHAVSVCPVGRAAPIHALISRAKGRGEKHTSLRSRT